MPVIFYISVTLFNTFFITILNMYEYTHFCKYFYSPNIQEI